MKDTGDVQRRVSMTSLDLGMSTFKTRKLLIRIGGIISSFINYMIIPWMAKCTDPKIGRIGRHGELNSFAGWIELTKYFFEAFWTHYDTSNNVICPKIVIQYWIKVNCTYPTICDDSRFFQPEKHWSVNFELTLQQGILQQFEANLQDGNRSSMPIKVEFQCWSSSTLKCVWTKNI